MRRWIHAFALLATLTETAQAQSFVSTPGAHEHVIEVEQRVALSVFADLTFSPWRDQQGFWRSGAQAALPVMRSGNFYLARLFSLFPALGLVMDAPSCDGCGALTRSGVALGARGHHDGHAGRPALTFRVDFPTGVTFGMSF